ncbi:hypothetical protein C8R44DRAFT_853230 [Mycena epipterygia]|nr:hypothetical protein C8R44DRAFT_853230 [Mycena epipterygia]
MHVSMQRVRHQKGSLFQGDESHVGVVLSLDWFRGGQWAQEEGEESAGDQWCSQTRAHTSSSPPNPPPPRLALTLPSTAPVRTGFALGCPPRSARSSGATPPGTPAVAATAPSAPPPPPPPRPLSPYPYRRPPEFRPPHQRFLLPLRRNSRAFCKHPPNEIAPSPSSYPWTIRHPPHPPPRRPHLRRPRASSSGGGRRFLGLGKDTCECERQRIRNAERMASSAAELLTLHESGHNTDDFEYDDVLGAALLVLALVGDGAAAGWG